MRIDLSNIMNAEGASLSVDLTEKIQISPFYPGEAHGGQASLKGCLSNENGDFRFIGDVLLKAEFQCDRCLKPVNCSIAFAMDEVFTKEELIDNALDLAPALTGNIAVNIPMKFLCSDDCKGLCAVCGHDLNEGGCNCHVQYVNPAFSGLSSLFDEEV